MYNFSPSSSKILMIALSIPSTMLGLSSFLDTSSPKASVGSVMRSSINVNGRVILICSGRKVTANCSMRR